MTKLVLALFFSCCFIHLKAQTDSLLQKEGIQIPEKYLDKVSSKTNSLEQKLDKKTQKALTQLKKQEAKIQLKLSKLDSTAAKNVFASSEYKYKELEQKLKNPSFKQYIPGLDTLSTSLKFLQQNSELLNQTKETKEKLDEAMVVSHSSPKQKINF